MAITRLNSLAIPAGTVEPADISYPLTNFSSTGIDDNADALAITIDSSENVGIGTASPTRDLQVEGVDPIIVSVISNTTGAGIGFKDSTTTADNVNTIRAIGNQLQLRADNNLSILTGGGSERIRITSTGGVGIGTTTPSKLLHAQGSGSAAQIMLESTSTDNGQMIFKNATATTGFYVGLLGDTSGNALLYHGDSGKSIRFWTNATERMVLDSSGNLILKPGRRLYLESSSGFSPHFLEASNALTIVTNNTERMRIDSSGNVGIGTSSPGYLLSLEGSNAAVAFTDSSRLSRIYTRNGGRDLEILGNQDVIINGSGGSSVGIGTTAPSDELEIYASNDTARIRLSGPGNSVSGAQFGMAGVTDAVLTNTENGVLIFGTNNTERMRILSSGGITFNGDTAAANALDDYEEGTWTPVLNGSPTHSASNQYYVKIGNLVHVGAYIYSVADYTSAVDFTISGLPYATNNARGVGSVMFRDINDTTIAQLNSYVSTNSSVVYFYASQNSGGTWDPLEYADGDSGLIDMIFNLTYLVS